MKYSLNIRQTVVAVVSLYDDGETKNTKKHNSKLSTGAAAAAVKEET